MALVAHPDDCVIFARPFIDEHPNLNWSIVYLTYCEADPRAQEVSAYWNARGIPTKFLGFADHYIDQETQQLNFWVGLNAYADLMQAAHDAELVLTHDEDGDYGHIHHKFVNGTVQWMHNVAKVYFANEQKANTICKATDVLDLEQFPLHKSVIEQFNDVNVGRYTVTDEAAILLRNQNENINT